MPFPVLRERDFKLRRNPSASRNKANVLKHEVKDRFLDDCFSKCPNKKCKKKELIEVAKPEENLIVDFCLSCGFKKEKELVKNG